MLTGTAHADALKELQISLPQEIMNWSAESADQIFDADSLFDYIDGGAEVYRAYNLKRCLSRRYIAPAGPAVVLDIFDMGASVDAYGVFTHDMNGEVVDIGQDGRLQPGWLSFWKDRFFVSIYAEEETPESRKAVMTLGKMVASLIKTKGPRPAIVAQLPTRGLLSDTVRYLHHPVVLNYHYFLADENLLNISKDTPVVLARYCWRSESALLLLAAYPNAKSARLAAARFLKHYLPDADQAGFAFLENGKWAAWRQQGNLAAIVLEADSRAVANQLLTGVFENR